MRLVVVVLLVAACRPPGYGKDGPHPDAASTTDGSAAPPIDAAPDAASVCMHAFRLDGHGTAQSVWLTGDFVNWAGTPQAGAVPFTLGMDGGWTLTYAFHAGQAQYKFIIDGSQWIPDPTNPDTIDDGFGGKNSVYVCTP